MSIQATQRGTCITCYEAFGPGDWIDRTEQGPTHAGVCPPVTAHGPDPDAPTLAELLHANHVPDQHTPAVRRAVAAWLTTWRGCAPTGANADETLDYLNRMLWMHR